MEGILLSLHSLTNMVSLATKNYLSLIDQITRTTEVRDSAQPLGHESPAGTAERLKG
jgi:hypothetical protein